MGLGLVLSQTFASLKHGVREVKNNDKLDIASEDSSKYVK